MAIVTSYTFGKLATQYELKDAVGYISRDYFIQNIYPNGEIYQFFTQRNLKRLYNYKFILENHDKLDAYEFVDKQPDTGQYVFNKGGKLKYHIYEDCSTLNNNYVDYNVPLEIRQQSLLEEYRKWFVNNNFREKHQNGEAILELVVQNYNNHFHRKYGIKKLDMQYKLIQDIPTGENRKADYSFNLLKFKARLAYLSMVRQDLCYGRTMNYLAYSDYLYKGDSDKIIKRINDITERSPETVAPEFIQNYGLDNLKKFWKTHHNLKSEVFSLLSKYFRWTYKLEKINFQEYTLNSFGLRCCRVCETRKFNEKS